METIKFEYKESSGILLGELDEIIESLRKYRERLHMMADEGGYAAPESSINLPSDEGMHNEIEAVAAKFKTSTLKYIVHIGIGGSVLGTQAIYEALLGSYDALVPNRLPKIIFIDTNCSGMIKTIRDLFRVLQNPEEVVIHVVSKSGTTTETIANFEIIYAFLKERFGEVKSRVVVTTDRGSKLWTAGETQGFTCLPIPQNVGGRYSVLSAAGILSLSLAGIDAHALREGASKMREICLSGNIEENIALISAAILYHHYQKGISIHNSFFFGPELESLGKWYRQLLAESIGKEGKGILPIVSIGSNDLHSVAQLYLGGPANIFTTFVRVEDGTAGIKVPTTPMFSGLVPGIAAKDFSEIGNAIYGGVLAAYKKRALPFVEIIFPEISAKTLGAYVQFKMIETMYLAHLLAVNAFDQPNVEEYKAETRRMLEGH